MTESLVGAIVGALIGAAFGAVCQYLISLKLRRKRMQEEHGAEALTHLQEAKQHYAKLIGWNKHSSKSASLEAILPSPDRMEETCHKYGVALGKAQERIEKTRNEKLAEAIYSLTYGHLDSPGEVENTLDHLEEKLYKIAYPGLKPFRDKHLESSLADLREKEPGAMRSLPFVDEWYEHLYYRNGLDPFDLNADSLKYRDEE